MVALATAFVRIEPDSQDFRRTADRQMGQAGRSGGERFGEGFYRAADGRMRDANNRFVREAADSGEQAGKRFGGEFADSMKVAMGVAIAAVGQAMVGKLQQGFTDAMDMSGAVGMFQAQLGVSAPKAGEIGKVAGKLYAGNFGENMGAVRTAVTSVIQNIDGMRGASSGALQQMAERAITTGQILNEDVGGVTRAVAQLMRTGLAKNAGQAFDIINAGAQQGVNVAGDLLDTISEYSTQFRSLGISGPRAFGLINQALKAGARDADTAADAIKEFAIRSKDGSASSAGAFKDLGFNAKTMFDTFARGGPGADRAFRQVVLRLKAMKNPTDRTATAVKLFGTKAEDLQDALFALDPTTAEKSLGKLAGTTDRASKAMGETAAARLETFKRALMTGVVNLIGGRVIPLLITMGDAVKGPLGGFVRFITGSSTAATYLRGALIGLASAYLAMRVATAAWAAIQVVLNAVLTANPIGLIVLAIGALIGVFVIAYQRSNTFRTIVQTAFRAIATAGRYMWNTVLKPIFAAFKVVLTNVIIPALRLYMNYVKFVFKAVATVAQWLWRTILQPAWKLMSWTLTRVLVPAFKTFASGARTAFNLVKSGISSGWSVIRGIFDALKRALGLVGTAFSRGATAIGSAWSRIKNLTKAPVNFVIGTVYNKGIVGLWNTVMGWLHLPSSLRLGRLPQLAQGGPLPAKPGIFNQPTAIVGEGRSAYPEYVIPTDPRYRGRAQALWQQAGGNLQMMADGGILGIVKRAAGKAVNIGKGALNLITNPGAVWDSLVSKWVPSAAGLANGPFGTAVAKIPKMVLGRVKTYAMSLIKAFASSYGGDGTGVAKAAISMIGRGDDRGENNNWLTRAWGMPGAPWCAMFVSEAIKQAGAQKKYRGYPSAAVASYNAGMRHVNVNDGRPGDLATYGSNDHINVVIKKVLGGYDTVGGNQGPRVNRYVRGGQASVLRPMAMGGKLVNEVYRQRNLDPNDHKSPILQAMRKSKGKGLFDSGGIVGPGWPFHKTKPEMVITGTQWNTLATLASRGSRPAVTVHATGLPSIPSETQIASAVDRSLIMHGSYWRG